MNWQVPINIKGYGGVTKPTTSFVAGAVVLQYRRNGAREVANMLSGGASWIKKQL
jgi:hypothetical protein